MHRILLLFPSAGPGKLIFANSPTTTKLADFLLKFWISIQYKIHAVGFLKGVADPFALPNTWPSCRGKNGGSLRDLLFPGTALPEPSFFSFEYLLLACFLSAGVRVRTYFVELRGSASRGEALYSSAPPTKTWLKVDVMVVEWSVTCRLYRALEPINHVSIGR